MSKDIKSLINLLIKKFEAGQFQEVIEKSIIVLKKNDNDFLWNLLGLSFQNINQITKSIDCFKNAFNLNPKSFTALNNLGLSYKKLKNFKKAEEYLLESLEINPQHINALVNLGNVKNDTYFFEKAIFYYEKAISIDDKIPLIYLNISNVYQTINRIEDAKNYLNKAISIDPSFTIADQKLTKLENYKEKNPHIESMIKKFESNDLKDIQKVYLGFGLYKVFKDIKDYNKSSYYLKIANQLQRKLLTYDINLHKSLSDKIKTIFSKLNLKDYDQNNSGKNYIFILGMPRSGTTLIEKIVSSHSKVSTISESNFIPEKIFKYINGDFEDLKIFLSSGLGNDYEKFMKSFNIKNEIIIDKTLTNFWYLGFIKILFPKSKIIHVSRNPKDNCLSIFENLFDQPEGWNSDQKELAEYYLIYKDLMNFWKELFGETILNIKYEELILDSEKNIRDLISFCDLNWEEECINFYKNNNPIKTVSVNQANKPIYKSSINKFKDYENDLDILFSKLN
tara:strand:+ start:924 stop:2447 length:1524 start_codon:yes stop_codon:yes gene_type:complete